MKNLKSLRYKMKLYRRFRWETSNLGCVGKRNCTQSEEGRDLELEDIVPDSCGTDDEPGHQSVRSEVEATIKLGKQLGVNCNNIEDLVRMVIEEELVTEGCE
ncbi:hypothetical protein L1987_78341 [Smallanthus sonchifolius]|uniref:Uncharacterized protein n=1 Tax=Smallanthus sonchifolius TaxID=185202 RepID=A0ACB8ZCE3_9ASTR|nr:hypothetical protein L1987_78341 [Smallanthus sonchifolius]